jgi:16S rRNA (guanine1207-N2)-methyltransferase
MTATGMTTMTTETTPLAPDAADRLLLDEAGALLSGDIVVVGDASGALAAGALEAGAATVRLVVDSIADEISALTSLAEAGLDDRVSTGALDDATLAGATLVLLRLPKSLDALDDIARRIALVADPAVVVFAGARLKYMSVGMNDVLQRSFGTLDVSLARQKSRVLIARAPLAVTAPAVKLVRQPDLDLVVAAVGGVFAGTSLDIGTRALVAAFGKLPSWRTAIDLGCGSGILASELKRRRPHARVIATDASAFAVASASATAKANDLDIEVVRDAGLDSQPDASVDLIVLNPPFHDGGAVTTDIALDLFEQAARVLKPGGELWTVWNSHLAYRPALQRLVGPTREISRNAKFTVTASVSRISETESSRLEPRPEVQE